MFDRGVGKQWPEGQQQTREEGCGQHRLLGVGFARGMVHNEACQHEDTTMQTVREQSRTTLGPAVSMTPLGVNSTPACKAVIMVVYCCTCTTFKDGRVMGQTVMGQ